MKCKVILLYFMFIVVMLYSFTLFASAEMALVSVNKNKLRVLVDEGDKKAKKLLKLSETAVTSRLSRARRVLKDEWTEVLKDEI